MTAYLEILPEVAEALARGQAVVALESAVIAHGLPRPENLQVARRLEQIVRERGAVPATVGVAYGRIRVGLDDELLQRFAEARGVNKVSRQDLPVVLATDGIGATTVAATVFCARLAGIFVLVTGGIGGVHRGGQESMDVSADLYELGRTDVAVVCSGAKGILDIGRTLEKLETLGVPVVGFGTDRFPSFWCRDSGYTLEHRADDAAQAARIVRTKWDLGLAGGVVIANPPPVDAALSLDFVEGHIETALSEAEAQGVRGKRLTPFLLSRLGELTGQASLRANVALLENNAAVGADIAMALADRAGGTSV